MLIMRELVYGPRRFGEIRANLPGISANVLTHRLEALAAAGILEKYKLPSPANVQVYDLTDWGREAVPLIRGLGRWAARSPRHDPLLFMSVASAMMSLETLIDHARAAAISVTIAFHFPQDHFVAALRDGTLCLWRGASDAADVIFTGDTMAMRRTIYGKEGVNRPGLLSQEGDSGAARAFINLFSLPEKIRREAD